MSQHFPHEQLDVYGVAVSFARLADDLLCSWPCSWAVHDQFGRASESILTNLAKAACYRATETGIYSLECSLGSVLECAACIDVARHRQLAEDLQIHSSKEMLQKIARMEIGLRSSWGRWISEEREPYATDGRRYFLHESLDVYQRSLQIHELLVALWKGDRIRSRRVKRIDELTTSLTINIAEGNGRFSRLDHSKFLGIAEDAGTKLAAYLDLIESSRIDIVRIKSYLREVMAMLSGLRSYLEE